MVTAYTTYQVTISDHESRLRTLEKQVLSFGTTISDVSSSLYTIKQDVAIIKYRLEDGKKSP